MGWGLHIGGWPRVIVGPETTCGICYLLVPSKVQRVLALVGTVALCSLIYGNPEKFRGLIIAINEYGGQFIWVGAITLTVGIGCLPPCSYKVYDSPIFEYILEIDILADMHLQTTMG